MTDIKATALFSPGFRCVNRRKPFVAVQCDGRICYWGHAARRKSCCLANKGVHKSRGFIQVFHGVHSRNNLPVNRCVSVCPDGATCLVRKHKGEEAKERLDYHTNI